MDITIASTNRPRLSRQTRLDWDNVREQHVLLAPEGVIVLNQTGANILELCDGERTFGEIVAKLHAKYSSVSEEEVRGFLDQLVARRLVEPDNG